MIDFFFNLYGSVIPYLSERKRIIKIEVLNKKLCVIKHKKITNLIATIFNVLEISGLTSN